MLEDIKSWQNRLNAMSHYMSQQDIDVAPVQLTRADVTTLSVLLDCLKKYIEEAENEF